MLRAGCLRLCTLLLVVLIAMPVLAGDAIGRATFVFGDVQARDRDGASRALARGGDLYTGDVIVTGADGIAQFHFVDDSRMVVRRSSEVALDEFQFGAGSERMVVRLAFGALRSISGLIGRHNKENVTFRTQVATIGIRGTDFEAVHIPLDRPDLLAPGQPVEPGTYNKVYAGGTQLVSKVGTLELGVNEAGFIGVEQGLGKLPVKIPQLPPSILKVISETPKLSKVGPGKDMAPKGDAPLQSEAATKPDKASKAETMPAKIDALKGNASKVETVLKPDDASKAKLPLEAEVLKADVLKGKATLLKTDTVLKADPGSDASKLDVLSKPLLEPAVKLPATTTLPTTTLPTITLPISSPATKLPTELLDTTKILTPTKVLSPTTTVTPTTTVPVTTLPTMKVAPPDSTILSPTTLQKRETLIAPLLQR